MYCTEPLSHRKGRLRSFRDDDDDNAFTYSLLTYLFTGNLLVIYKPVSQQLKLYSKQIGDCSKYAESLKKTILIKKGLYNHLYL